MGTLQIVLQINAAVMSEYNEEPLAALLFDNWAEPKTVRKILGSLTASIAEEKNSEPAYSCKLQCAEWSSF